MFWDVNEMYPATFKENFPTGIGFDWQLNGSQMRKKLLTNAKISMVSLEWLDFMSEDLRFKKSNEELV